MEQASLAITGAIQYALYLCWLAFYPLITIGAVVLTAIGQRQNPVETKGAASAAVLISITCVLSNLSHAFVRFPYNQFYPVIDFFVVIILTLTWWRDPKIWQCLLIALFAADLWLHAQFFKVGDRSFAARYRYDLMLNGIYILQLACPAASTLNLWWQSAVSSRIIRVM